MAFWYGSGTADPCLRLMDPDPAISSLTFMTPIENYYFLKDFLLFEGTFISFFKD
jgi:hypothetical protein